jgi:hypothetical protein
MQNKFFGSKLNTVLPVIIIIILGVTIYLIQQNKILTIFDGLGQKPQDETIVQVDNLSTNINSFMELHASQDSFASVKQKYYCGNFLYGQDEKYAYTWVYCTTGIDENHTAFSTATRFEYVQPYYQIINYKQPDDGEGWGISLKKLFPKKYYDKAMLSAGGSTPEMSEMFQSVDGRIQGGNISLLKACPDEIMIPQVSQVGIGSMMSYYIYRDKNYNIADFDAVWVKNNCHVKKTVVY